jgi:hypothetical protein
MVVFKKKCPYLYSLIQRCFWGHLSLFVLFDSELFLGTPLSICRVWLRDVFEDTSLYLLCLIQSSFWWHLYFLCLIQSCFWDHLTLLVIERGVLKNNAESDTRNREVPWNTTLNQTLQIERGDLKNNSELDTTNRERRPKKTSLIQTLQIVRGVLKNIS